MTDIACILSASAQPNGEMQRLGIRRRSQIMASNTLKAPRRACLQANLSAWPLLHPIPISWRLPSTACQGCTWRSFCLKPSSHAYFHLCHDDIMLVTGCMLQAVWGTGRAVGSDPHPAQLQYWPTHDLAPPPGQWVNPMQSVQIGEAEVQGQQMGQPILQGQQMGPPGCLPWPNPMGGHPQQVW